MDENADDVTDREGRAVRVDERAVDAVSRLAAVRIAKGVDADGSVERRRLARKAKSKVSLTQVGPVGGRLELAIDALHGRLKVECSIRHGDRSASQAKAYVSKKVNSTNPRKTRAARWTFL